MPQEDIACIGWEVNSNARLNVRNNILVNNHNSSSSYVIHYPMPITSSSVLNSDYNNLFVSGSNSLIAFYNSLNCSSLNNWQSATTRDLNSKSKIVYFISANDLHLINSSIGDIELMAEPVSWVYTDIDDEFRNLLFPYKGADERPEAPLPVELINFSAILIDEKVKLRWQTVTEVNSYGFEVERKIIDQQDWEMIGFVPGSGNSNSPKNYKLVDEVPNKRTSYLYRLKQIDTNGGFKYSNIIEVEWRIQINFALEQNYPNPFNPSTSIQYSVASTEHVTLKIYDILGNEIASLVNEEKEPGIYRAEFNTQDYQLASGIYLYRIQVENLLKRRK